MEMDDMGQRAAPGWLAALVYIDLQHQKKLDIAFFSYPSCLMACLNTKKSEYIRLNQATRPNQAARNLRPAGLAFFIRIGRLA
jgi:hypothetical protein